ncbi:armadillo-type protein [Gongronella butleri]|nr:armadillo-type protein [Gongronella butleri]
MASDLAPLVLEHLSQLYSAHDATVKKQASRWLEDFQKKPDAWQVADLLINNPSANMETRLFAAQTLRQKITYDLQDLDGTARASLRDSLLVLLGKSAGSKAITVQLCIALADLAAQFKEWKSVLQDIVDNYAGNPATAFCLLEFLKVLPEELANNRRLPLTDKEYEDRNVELLENSASEIIRLLLMYLQSSGGNVDIQQATMECLMSWMRAGVISIQMLGETPLLMMAFDGLEHEELLDVCSDVVCAILFELRDVDECKSLIEQVYPRFTPMLAKIQGALADEDDDRVRTFGRIFVQAGEAVIPLLAKHPEAFQVLLHGILAVGTCTDLDVALLSSKFWYDLTNTLVTDHYAPAIPQFHPYFDQLVDIILRQIQYPAEDTTAAEIDDFKAFRHDIGDTLKDCCRILTPQKCLAKPMIVLSQRMRNDGQPASWQEIEAPIFALRTMGAEVPDDENEIMPQIMATLSELPEHPKIRYAATLVISCYSFWTRKHPDLILYQLNFISSGFGEPDVAAASALALKNLCRDCNKVLVNYIEQLHPFYIGVVKMLPYRDAIEVTEAVAHVLDALPVANLPGALQSFCMPIAQELHEKISIDKLAATKDDLTRAADMLEIIATFLLVIHPKVEAQQPHPCVEFIKELWPIFTACLVNFGDRPPIAESLTNVFKLSMNSYGKYLLPILPQLFDLIDQGFTATFLGDYMWLAKSAVRIYASEDHPNSSMMAFGLLQRISTTLFAKIDTGKFDAVPDVIQQYFLMAGEFIDAAPSQVIQSELLPTMFEAGLVGLAMEDPSALSAIIGFYTRLLGIALSVDGLVVATPSPVYGQNGARIAALFTQFGQNFVSRQLDGMMFTFPSDLVQDGANALKRLAQLKPEESGQWVLATIETYNDVVITDRNQLLENYVAASHARNWSKIRRLLADFANLYRRKNTKRRR